MAREKLPDDHHGYWADHDDSDDDGDDNDGALGEQLRDQIANNMYLDYVNYRMRH